MGKIRSNGRQPNLVSIRGHDGDLKTSKIDIANAFAHFYEDLYSSRHVGDRMTANQNKSALGDDIECITSKEVEDELHKMAKNRSGDKAGIAAEMLKLGNENLRCIIAE
eukprot:5951066-Karenia_brevis.AAC.1